MAEATILPELSFMTNRPSFLMSSWPNEVLILSGAGLNLSAARNPPGQRSHGSQECTTLGKVARGQGLGARDRTRHHRHHR